MIPPQKLCKVIPLCSFLLAQRYGMCIQQDTLNFAIYSSSELFTSVQSGINFDRYEDIPVEATGNDAPKSIETVSLLHLLYKKCPPKILSLSPKIKCSTFTLSYFVKKVLPYIRRNFLPYIRRNFSADKFSHIFLQRLFARNCT